jgi:MFS family permease
MSVYAALLARPGARALAVACSVGWLSYASLGLAVVLLVEVSSGSFAAAGAAVGAFSGAAGTLAPFRGRLVDRHGARALLLLAGGYGLGLCALLLGSAARWPTAAFICAATVAGGFAPPLIAVARALWPHVAGAEFTRAAHALNALLGDLGMVLGPAAVGGLAAWLGPAAALAALGAGPLMGCAIVSWLGVPHRHDGSPARNGGTLLASPGLRTLAGAGVSLGLALGALEVAAPALAAHEGAPESAAIPLAAFAAGSVASSVWAGQSGRAGEPQRRYVVGFAWLAVVLSLCLFIRTLPWLAAVLAVAGIGFGLLNVALLELLDTVVPGRNAVEALTWLTSAEGLGLAVGGAIAGALATASLGAAFAVVALAAPCGAVVTFVRRGTLAAIDGSRATVADRTRERPPG